MRRRRTGRRLHDPAWHDQDFSRRRHAASGNRPACVRGNHCRRQGRGESSDRPEKPRIRTTKRPVSVHNPAHWLRSCDRGYEPQIKISIAFNCGPRVPSSGTFVRLPAPETLHERGLAVSGMGKAIADIQQSGLRSRADLLRYCRRSAGTSREGGKRSFA